MSISVINLGDLDGSNGFRLDGKAEYDFSGGSVSNAGDINGDGFDDVIVNASGVYLDNNGSGASYVVFGKASGFDAAVDLFNLDGTNGFRLNGEAGILPPYSIITNFVSNAGDVNGDGFDDVLVGAHLRDGTSGVYPHDIGYSYVIFGKSSGFRPEMDLSSLDGTNGFRLTQEISAGSHVSSAGDVNGDGFGDLILGAPTSFVVGGQDAGYIVFGKAGGFSADMDVSSLDGNNGFRLIGGEPYGNLGYSVSDAGDVNGDGFDDVIIGAPAHANYGSGSSYVVFGKAAGFNATLDLASLNGNNGFRLDGAVDGDESGGSVSSAGDVNGDGFADLIIGASKADPNGNQSGSSYVVFGKASGFSATVDLSSLNGSNGFRLDGAAGLDYSGSSVSSAGDVNGDGFDDLLVGAASADSNGENSGSSYVIFGHASGFAATLNLSSLDSSNGFRLDGAAGGDLSGGSVSSAGDVNNDGFDDLIVGAIGADPNGDRSGSSYVIFGRSDFGGTNLIKGTPRNDVLKGTQGDDTFEAGGGNDIMFGYGGADVFNAGIGNDTLDGGSGNDTLIGGTGADTMSGGWGNDSYFVDNIRDKVIEKANQGKDHVTSNITYTLSANVENLTLTGQAKINATGNGLANVIIGNNASNQLKGGAGNDILDGGLGSDKLTGGVGNDIFKFTNREHADIITDYNVSNDTIQLENAVFKSLSTEGTLPASQFRVGTKPLDTNDFIIYNKIAGTLLYDADGSGGAAATQIAIIGTGLNLTHADIVVI